MLALTIMLVALTGGLLYGISVFIHDAGWDETDAKLLGLAEAGLHRAMWLLKTPLSAGGKGENWVTSGVTESLGDGTYTMVVERWDFALASNGSTASATSSSSGNPPGNAIDGNNSTYWESGSAPTPSNPQDLIIRFPYPITLNKVRFLAQSSATRPQDYQWAVSSDGTTYTTVVSKTGNGSINVTDTFPAQKNVQYLRLRTTRPGTSGNRVRILTLEAIGSRITSEGTITVGSQSYTRRVRQSVVADDGSPQSKVVYIQPDWTEL
jgi:hypothetical protein